MRYTLSKKHLLGAFILGASNLIVGGALFTLHYPAYKSFLIWGGGLTAIAFLLLVMDYLIKRSLRG